MDTTENKNIDTITESLDHLYYPSNELVRAKQIYRWIVTIGIIPVCFLGLVANTVSVWVWNAHRKNNMVLLFQCLGVADNLFLLLTALRSILYLENQYPEDAEIYVVPWLLFSQSLSVHVTVVVAGLRWLGVARPQLMQRVTHCYIILTCVGLAVWSALLAGLVVVMDEQFDPHHHEYLVMGLMLQTVTFFLPNLVLLGFSIALLTIMCHRRRHLSTNKHRRTTMAVLSIAGCSLLSCILGETGKLLAMLPMTDGCVVVCVYTLFGMGMLLQVFNSSINMVFYFFVASRFRPLLLRTLCCCSARLQSIQRKVSTTSSTQLSSLSGTGNIQPQDNAGELTQEPPRELTQLTSSEQAPLDEATTSV